MTAGAAAATVVFSGRADGGADGPRRFGCAEGGCEGWCEASTAPTAGVLGG